MNDYIAKPVDERLLYSKIMSLIRKQQPPQGSDTKRNVVGESTVSRCVDLSYLIRRTKSDPKLMMEMISLYLEQTPPLINTMKQSLIDQDWASLQAAVHKMIPSFSIMGISNDFEAMAKRVQEYASTQQQTQDIQDMVLKIEDVCRRACVELEEEYNLIKKTAQ